jgi:hypothetical protein
MANFDVDIRQWKTVAEFEAHLKAHDPAIAPWATGVIIHHTWSPVPQEWHGRTTMNGLMNFYISKGWSAGPHLFICSGAPNPADDGIWQLTPLNMVGIHAGECNTHNWGIEVVGDYDNQPWSAGTKNLVVGAAAALMRWRSLSVTANSLKGHRDCNSPKTCPGKAIDMSVVRGWVSSALSPVTPQVITANDRIIADPRVTQDKAVSYILNRKPKAAYSTSDFHNLIVPAYFAITNQCGVDPCMALAQAIHENANFSSWWVQVPRRNPAGVGVTGESRTTAPHPEDVNAWAYKMENKRYYKGLVFDTWQLAALAHVGRLLAYATTVSERTTTQQRIVDQALAFRPLPLRLQGVAPTLAGLNGKWAVPGTTYGQAIAAIATEMVK